MHFVRINVWKHSFDISAGPWPAHSPSIRHCLSWKSFKLLFHYIHGRGVGWEGGFPLTKLLQMVVYEMLIPKDAWSNEGFQYSSFWTWIPVEYLLDVICRKTWRYIWIWEVCERDFSHSFSPRAKEMISNIIPRDHILQMLKAQHILREQIKSDELKAINFDESFFLNLTFRSRLYEKIHLFFNQILRYLFEKQVQFER